MPTWGGGEAWLLTAVTSGWVGGLVWVVVEKKKKKPKGDGLCNFLIIRQ